MVSLIEQLATTIPYATPTHQHLISDTALFYQLDCDTRTPIISPCSIYVEQYPTAFIIRVHKRDEQLNYYLPVHVAMEMVVFRAEEAPGKLCFEWFATQDTNYIVGCTLTPEEAKEFRKALQHLRRCMMFANTSEREFCREVDGPPVYQSSRNSYMTTERLLQTSAVQEQCEVQQTDLVCTGKLYQIVAGKKNLLSGYAVLAIKKGGVYMYKLSVVNQQGKQIVETSITPDLNYKIEQEEYSLEWKHLHRLSTQKFRMEFDRYDTTISIRYAFERILKEKSAELMEIEERILNSNQQSPLKRRQSSSFKVVKRNSLDQVEKPQQPQMVPVDDNKMLEQEEPIKPVSIPNIVIINKYKPSNVQEEESSPPHRKSQRNKNKFNSGSKSTPKGIKVPRITAPVITAPLPSDSGNPQPQSFVQSDMQLEIESPPQPSKKGRKSKFVPNPCSIRQNILTAVKKQRNSLEADRHLTTPTRELRSRSKRLMEKLQSSATKRQLKMEEEHPQMQDQSYPKMQEVVQPEIEMEPVEDHAFRNCFTQAKTSKITIVSKGQQLEFMRFEHQSLQTVAGGRILRKNKTPLVPYKIVLQNKDSKAMIRSQGGHLSYCDLNTLEIIQEYAPEGVEDICPERKLAELDSYDTFLGVTEKSIHRIDPRVGRSAFRYTHDYRRHKKFTNITTTMQGCIAVGAKDGDIRLYPNESKPFATSRYVGQGQPVLHLQTSKNQRWLLATYKTYIQLLPTFMGENSLFYRKTNIANRPHPMILTIRKEHLGMFGVTDYSFIPAHFDECIATGQKFIVSGFNEYIVVWTLSRVQQGDFSYNFYKTSQPVKQVEFMFDNPSSLIVAYEDHLQLKSGYAI